MLALADKFQGEESVTGRLNPTERAADPRPTVQCAVQSDFGDLARFFAGPSEQKTSCFLLQFQLASESGQRDDQQRCTPVWFVVAFENKRALWTNSRRQPAQCSIAGRFGRGLSLCGCQCQETVTSRLRRRLLASAIRPSAAWITNAKEEVPGRCDSVVHEQPGTRRALGVPS